MDPYLRVVRACDLDVAPEVEAFHDLTGPCRYIGQAQIDRGRHPLARLICMLAGYPNAGGAVPVTVTLTPTEQGAIWTREFGSHVTRSTLWTSLDERVLVERLGLFTLRMTLSAEDEQLYVTVVGMSVLGLPVPSFLLPRGETYEFAKDGRFHFDVSGVLPGIGLMIRYRGALEPEG
ncbi:DUF4166 domain-containing protein [Aliiroseovarius sp.]|uniref:DUF4166 domain-containing protein n=1 Tax=Aliiroseovarius sp. TaxID=1872442 RepID=UPI003BA8C05B